MARKTTFALCQAVQPTLLFLPESDDVDDRFWMTRWERRWENSRRIELGMWDTPHRNTWVNKLNLEIQRVEGPIILVAHGLECVTVAWWAEFEQPRFGDPVIGALLVAPPDVERPGLDPRLARFGACPRKPLPFPSFVVASRDDPSCPFHTAASLARDWGARLAYGGDVGHFDARSDLGDWPDGEHLLERLVAESGQHREHLTQRRPEFGHAASADRTGSLIDSEMSTGAPWQ